MKKRIIIACGLLLLVAFMLCPISPFVRAILIFDVFYEDEREQVLAPGDSLYIPSPDQIEQARAFSEDLAAVRIGGLWGFVDSTGRLVIPPVFGDAYDFSTGIAIVRKGFKSGVITKTGQYLIPLDDVFVFSNFKDSLGVVRTQFYEYCIVDLRAKTVHTVEPDDIESAKAFSEGLLAVQKDGKWGFLDREGWLRIPFSFDQVLNFSEGLCPVALGNKWGYIDTTGWLVIEPQYQQAEPFSEGLASVFLDSSNMSYKGIFIDKSGHRVDSVRCYMASTVVDSLAPVAALLRGKDGKDRLKWSYFSFQHSDYIRDFDLDGADPFSEGFARVRQGDKWGYLARDGVFSVKPKYEEATSFKRGHAFVKKDGGWYIIGNSRKSDKD